MFYISNAKTFQYAHALRANMTWAENKLWARLSNKQLNGCRFKRQHPIANYITDFYCHKAKLIIEVDGKIHEEAMRIIYDQDRTKAIEQLGCRVLRFTNEDVLDRIDDVISAIRKEIASPSGEVGGAIKQNTTI
jgi:very-short-patch-repair endonuclease